MPTFQIVALAPTKICGESGKPAIAIAAARVGALGFIEFSGLLQSNIADPVAESLKICRAACPDGKFGLYLTCSQLSNLVQSNQSDFLTGLTIVLTDSDQSSKLDALNTYKGGSFILGAEVFGAREAVALEKAGASLLVAKGNEAYGLSGSKTSFILTQEIVNAVEVPVWTRGGIGPHSVAAVQAAGASGVVLDNQLYLARDSHVPERVKRLIRSLDGSGNETVVEEAPGRQNFRYFRRREAVNAAEREESSESSGSHPSPAQELPLEGWCLRKKSLILAGHQAEHQPADQPINRFLKSEPDMYLLGQDAAFATNLEKAGGTVAGIIDIYLNNVRTYSKLAAKDQVLARGSALAVSHKTEFPIVQGAMTRVSDNAEFTRSVAEEGALPFLALSLMRSEEIETLLSKTSKLLGDRSWGVGILGFLPSQMRNEQLEVIRKYKPPFALIAGGRPDQAEKLEKEGTATYLHVPSPSILKSFVDMGARRFIFEGNECGGHTGPRSSFILWEQMIDVLLSSTKNIPEENNSFHILFAGGIHDAQSAAMVATMAAPLSNRGMRIGVLLGTAYLYTEEAVRTGAIVEEFQKQAIKCDDTVLLETGPGHSIRCVETPYKVEFDSKKKKLIAEKRSRTEVKDELERMHLGRLRLASKGLERKGKELMAVSEQEQLSRGMYMIGQLSCLKQTVQTIRELHEDISSGGTDCLKQLPLVEFSQAKEHNSPKESIAIVGMACNLPMSNDLERFWRNIIDGVDAIEEVPADHWDWKKFYDKDRFASDKAISKWGGFIKNIVFNPSAYGIPPKSLESIDPVQILMLEVVRQALEDAGYSERRFPRKKASMLLANAGHGPIAAKYAIRCMMDNELDDLLDEKTKNQIRAQMPTWSEDSLPGNLSNVTAGRVSNRFDLSGINFCVDAACASSLAAMYVGVNDLRSRASDLVVLGSADTHNNPIDFLNFSKTHALSESGRCNTFDAAADGIVLGEGIAAIILKRLEDAERDGDKIYALIRGIGGSSDGRALSLTAPRPEGQMLALERAYENAGVNPSTISLVEAHGTGTVAGDKAEVNALSQIFSRDGAKKESCAIGSVKTNIGHTKCTAGLASTIKVAKALYHKVLPPTIGVKEPNPACKFGDNPFYINSESRPWLNSQAVPRRAAVSAFGFGGTNFHAVLEEYRSPLEPVNQFVSDTWSGELFTYRARNEVELLRALSKTEKELNAVIQQKSLGLDSEATSLDQTRLTTLASLSAGRSSSVEEAELSLAIVALNLDDLQVKLARSKELLEKGNCSTDATKASDKNYPRTFKDPRGIFFNSQPMSRKDKVAFLFPGQGSQRVNMLRDLSLYFPEIRQQFEQADCKLPMPIQEQESEKRKSLSSYVFPIPGFGDDLALKQKEELADTRIAQPALGVADLAVAKILASFGIKPDMVAGHSYGELVALCVAGAITEDELLKISWQRGQILSSTAENGTMLAVLASVGQISDLLKSVPSVSIANQNSPSQTVLAGDMEGIAKFSKLAQKKGIQVREIPVSRAFHSPLMEPAVEPLKKSFSDLDLSTPRIPVFSNATATVYPTETKGQKELLAQHIVSPVRFDQELKSMRAEGATIFIECGPGAVLTNLVEANFPDDKVKALSIERHGKDGLWQFLSFLAECWSSGLPLKIEKLFEGRKVAPIEFNQENERSLNMASRLNFKVNSVSIEPLGRKAESKESKEPEAPSKSVAYNPSRISTQSSKNLSTKASSPMVQGNASPRDASAVPSISQPLSKEAVLLNFQNSMLEATQTFIAAQKEAMLAYLGATSGGGSNTIKSPTQWLDSTIKSQELPSAPEKIEEASQLQSEPLDSTESFIDKEALIENLYEIVAERTGYPVEMLDPDLDLEADLGIDSIKRIEIFNGFRKLLPEDFKFELEGNIEELAELKTLSSISNWIRELDLEKTLNISEPKEKENASYINDALKVLTGGGSSEQNSQSRARVRRERIKLDLARLENESKSEEYLPGPGKVLIITSPSENPGNEELFDALTRSLINSNCLVERKTTDEDRDDFLVGAGDDADLPECIIYRGEKEGLLSLAKEIKSLHDAGGLKNYHPTLITLTGFGGKMLLDSKLPESLMKDTKSVITNGALAGMTNTIALEMDFLRTFYLDIDPEESKSPAALKHQIDTILKLIKAGSSHGEYALKDGILQTPYLIPAPHDLDHSSKENKVDENRFGLNEKSLILVTGGARGITAELTLALAKRYHSNFVILGQSPAPAQESKETISLDDPKDLKAALMKNAGNNGNRASIKEIETRFRQLLKDREIRRNLDRIKTYASSVRYYSVDVKDELALSELIDSLYEVNPSIDAVIHGAGIIEDSNIQNKSLDSFKKVYDTKVAGALTLANRLKLDQVKFMYLFSSVVGRTGNPGQIDYVAANESLNKLASYLNKQTSCSVKSIMWGPWRGGMAPPELEKVFESYGWGMIEPDRGAEAFLEELEYGSIDDAEVILVGEPIHSARVTTTLNRDWTGPVIQPAVVDSRQPMVLQIPFKRSNHIYLEDHKLDSIPVLPMAVAVETMLEAATLAYGGRSVKSIEDFDIPSGVVFDSDDKNLEVIVESISDDRAAVSVSSVSSRGLKKLHHRAIVNFFVDGDASLTSLTQQPKTTALGSKINSTFTPESIQFQESTLPTIKHVYDQWLFHGPRFQGIQKIAGLGLTGIAGNVKGQDPANCLVDNGGMDWILDPTLFDSAMQLGAVWARHYSDITCLPTGFKSMQFFKSDIHSWNTTGGRSVDVMVHTVDKTFDGEVVCDLAIYGSDGNLCILVESLAGIGSKAFNRFATATASGN